MRLLKASACRGLVIPVEVKKVSGDVVYLTNGSVNQMTNGYVRYFLEEQMSEAMKWINHQRKRWGEKLLTKKEMKYEQ